MPRLLASVARTTPCMATIGTHPDGHQIVLKMPHFRVKTGLSAREKHDSKIKGALHAERSAFGRERKRRKFLACPYPSTPWPACPCVRFGRSHLAGALQETPSLIISCSTYYSDQAAPLAPQRHHDQRHQLRGYPTAFCRMAEPNLPPAKKQMTSTRILHESPISAGRHLHTHGDHTHPPGSGDPQGSHPPSYT